MPLRYPPDILANARDLVTNPDRHAALPAAEWVDLAETAWSILKQDHAARRADAPPVPATPAPTGILRPIPLALFQAGPPRLRHRPLPPCPQGTPPSGDAA